MLALLFFLYYCILQRILSFYRMEWEWFHKTSPNCNRFFLNSFQTSMNSIRVWSLNIILIHDVLFNMRSDKLIKVWVGKLLNMLQISMRPHKMDSFSIFCCWNFTWTPNKILFAEINNDFHGIFKFIYVFVKLGKAAFNPMKCVMNVKNEENLHLLIKHLWCEQCI